jgi:hypothetical protein
VLQWGQRKFTKTLILDTVGANVATMYDAPGYRQFDAFCMNCEDPDDDDSPVTASAHVMKDDETIKEKCGHPEINDDCLTQSESDANSNETFLSGQGEEHRFDLQGPEVDAPAIVPDKENTTRKPRTGK